MMFVMRSRRKKAEVHVAITAETFVGESHDVTLCENADATTLRISGGSVQDTLLDTMPP